MNINWGLLEHLRTITDRMEKHQSLLAEEKELVLQLFFGYYKVKGGKNES